MEGKVRECSLSRHETREVVTLVTPGEPEGDVTGHSVRVGEGGVVHTDGEVYFQRVEYLPPQVNNRESSLVKVIVNVVNGRLVVSMNPARQRIERPVRDVHPVDELVSQRSLRHNVDGTEGEEVTPLAPVLVVVKELVVRLVVEGSTEDLTYGYVLIEGGYR